MKKKEYLFQLIKSLNREEKRHFKLFVHKYNTRRENNYLKLFNAIDKQDIYDEDALKEIFRGETFIKQLTVTKHYLQKLVIKSLQNLHYDNTVGLSVLSLHHQIAILFAKGHYDLCRDLVKKGIEISSRHELFLEWIGFLKRDLDLINKTDLTEYKKNLTKYLEKTSQLIAWYEINTRGNHLTNELQIFSLDTPTFGYHNTQYENLIEKINNLIDSIEAGSLPIKARLNLYYPLAQSYLLLAEYSKAYNVYMQLFDELTSEYKSKELHEPYINILTGLIYASNAASKPETLKLALNELNQVPEINLRVKFKKAESQAFYPLYTCALKGDFYSGHTAVEIIESFLETYSEFCAPAEFMYAYYYAAYTYFGVGNYNQALRYLRKTDTYYNKDLLPNLRLALRIMEMIIFFEQKKFELVESRLRGLIRQMQKEENVKAFLKEYLRYFHRIVMNEMDRRGNTELYQQVLDELLQIPVKEQITMFIHFDLISWIQSKLENCSFGERLQKNADRLFTVKNE